MKLSKYKNIRHSTFWSSDWSVKANRDKLFGMAIRNQDDQDLVSSPDFETNSKRATRSSYYIASPSMLTIMRECAICVSNPKIKGTLIYPQIIISPIGPITEDIVIEVTKKINNEQFEKRVSQQNSNARRLSSRNYPINLHWDYNAYLNLINDSLKTAVSIENLDVYLEGIFKTLQSMLLNSWDEKNLYLYLTLNRFLGDTSGETTLESYTKDNAAVLDNEFNTFNGTVNEHTANLNTAWDSILYPKGSNSTKLTKFLGSLTHDDLVSMVNKISTPKTYWEVTAKNQVQVLENIHRSIDGELENLSKPVISDMLAEVFMNAHKGNGVTSAMLSAMGTIIDFYTKGSKEIDPNSTAIVKYLYDNSSALSFSDVATVLYAATSPNVLLTSGSFDDSRKLVVKLLTESRDPEESLMFIVQTSLHYDGPVPTLRRWENLIESDLENKELSLSPSLAFAISETSESKNTNRNSLNYLKNLLKDASERAL